MGKVQKYYEGDKEKGYFSERSFIEFMSASMKGISQIVLMENVISGIVILIAITVASVNLGIVSLLSVIIGTLVAIIGGADKMAIDQGLFGYNSVLTGIALTLFLSGPYSIPIALGGAALAAILTATLMHFFIAFEIPVLTSPFVFITWFMLLVTYKLEAVDLDPSFVPQSLSNWSMVNSDAINWLDGFLLGISQIFFLENLISAILIFIAFFIAGWRFGVYAIIASLTGILTAYFLGGEYSLMSIGIYGYNAILTIVAVSIVFNLRENKYALISGIFGSGLTVFVTASLSIWLLPFGLTALTMPFVICTWIFLAARKVMPNL